VAAGATQLHQGGTFTYSTGATLAGAGSWSFTSGNTIFNIAFSPAGSVSETGGELTLNAANQAFGSFVFTGGTVDGPGNLTITSAMTWADSIMSGSGTLTIGAAATLTFNGSNVGLLRNVVNNGTTNWTSGNIGGFGGSGVTFTNHGVFTASGTVGTFSNNSSTNTLVNTGTFTKNGATTLTFNAALTTSGILTVSAGTLHLNGGGGLGGTMALAATTFLDTTGSFADVTGTVSGNGTCRFQGGSHALTGTLTIQSLTSIDNTNFTGAGNLILDSTVDWNSGSMVGTGTTTLAAGRTLTMNTVSSKGLGRTLVNNGTINHSAGALQFLGGGTLVNNAGKHYNLTGAAQMPATGSNNAINNAGVFAKDTATTVNIQAAFNNTGALNLIQGILNLDGGGTNTGARNILLGTTLDYRASYTHGAGSTLAGSGSVNLEGGTQTISGDWTANTFLKLVNGTLDGPGTLTTIGPFYWLSGTMTGSGAIHISGNGKLAISNPADHTLSRNIINDGVLHYLDGTLALVGTTITNTAGHLFAILPDATLAVSGGINVINNAGILRKFSSSIITFDSALGGVTVNNTGMIDVRGGILNLNGPVPQVSGSSLNGGTWQVYPASVLSLGTVAIRTIAAGTTLNLYGGVDLLPNISAMNTNNGTMNFPFSAIFDVTPAGGTFTNNGVLDFGAVDWFRVHGNFVQSAGATLNIDLQANQAFGRIIASGTSTLGGTVAFEFVNGFSPAAGVVFDFITSTGHSGQFATTTIPALSGRTTSVVYIGGASRLRVV
jgi:autotransporter-associated beta strand protein